MTIKSASTPFILPPSPINYGRFIIASSWAQSAEKKGTFIIFTAELQEFEGQNSSEMTPSPESLYI